MPLGRRGAGWGQPLGKAAPPSRATLPRPPQWGAWRPLDSARARRGGAHWAHCWQPLFCVGPPDSSVKATLGAHDSWCSRRGWAASAGRGGAGLRRLVAAQGPLPAQPASQREGTVGTDKHGGLPGPGPPRALRERALPELTSTAGSPGRSPRAPRERAPLELTGTAGLSKAWPGLCCGKAELDITRRGSQSRSLISGEKQKAGGAAGSPSCPQGPPGQKDQHKPGLQKEEEDEETAAGGHPCPGTAGLEPGLPGARGCVGPVLWGDAALPRWDPAP